MDNTNKSQVEREMAEARRRNYKDDTLVFDANNKLDKTASETMRIKADVLQHLREQQLKPVTPETKLKRETDKQGKQTAPKRKRTASPSTRAKRTASPSTRAKRTKQAEDMHPK